MKAIVAVIVDILGYKLYTGANVKITVGTVVFAVVVFLVTYLILKLSKKTIVKIFGTKGDEHNIGRIETVFNFISYFIYVIVFFSMVSAIGININMLLTATAALFVGLGFALQQIFQDLIAGIYILLDKTLNIGDVIQIDGKVARVKGIHLRSTIAETRDHRIIIIPNRVFVNDIIHNWTQDHEMLRAAVEVGVYIGTDVQLVREVLLKSVEGVKDVLKDPAPSVIIDQFGESSIRFSLRYFIIDGFNNDVIASDIRFEIDRLFRENGIKLPVPVLRLDNTSFEN